MRICCPQCLLSAISHTQYQDQRTHVPEDSLIHGHVTLSRIIIYEPVGRRVDTGDGHRKLLEGYQRPYNQGHEYKRLYLTGRGELSHPLLVRHRRVSDDHIQLLYREDKVR